MRLFKDVNCRINEAVKKVAGEQVEGDENDKMEGWRRKSSKKARSI